MGFLKIIFSADILKYLNNDILKQIMDKYRSFHSRYLKVYIFLLLKKKTVTKNIFLLYLSRTITQKSLLKIFQKHVLVNKVPQKSF